MDFILDEGTASYKIKSAELNRVEVNHQTLNQSFLLMPEQLVYPWPVSSLLQLDAEQAQHLLTYKPELVLLGYGTRTHTPPAGWFGELLGAGIGVEIMDLVAACRTYTVCMSEDRQVLLACVMA